MIKPVTTKQMNKFSPNYKKFTSKLFNLEAIGDTKNLYLSEEAKYHVKSGLKYFVSSVVGGAPLERVEMQFISDLFNNLVSEGKLIPANTRQGISYRTTTDKDIKESKKR